MVGQGGAMPHVTCIICSWDGEEVGEGVHGSTLAGRGLVLGRRLCCQFQGVRPGPLP